MGAVHVHQRLRIDRRARRRGHADEVAFIFPSLGPAFLFFFTPTLPTASPRHTLLGHAIGIACGYGALLVTGLEHAPPAIVTGVDLPRVLAAALSLAATGALMILLKAAHPPAGATTLIISLGIVRRHSTCWSSRLRWRCGRFINRMAGIDYPLWARRTDPTSAKGS